ncbi:hypothetical protein [Paenibacillus sp. FJAT-26967]|uniref:hypothetical protein n=1 Tax=Paenibacillus sp. FJAT-26967 TaxID=1729690 RepID=UPI00083966D1|nr:hypothetical protein [Paenibacillus sp. FJAT-26967]
MNSTSVTLLASGNSLGAYMPAMHLDRFLQSQGISTHVHVLENLYHAEVRNKIRATKAAFHASFSVARMGHKLAKPVDTSLKEEEVEKLLRQWRENGQSRFAVFTGFWLPIMERYKTLAGFQVDIQLIRMDAYDTPSFKVHRQLCAHYDQVWFYDPASLPRYYVSAETDEPISYEKRSGRYLIHGGGWGIGTYQDTVEALRERGCQLDVIVYDHSEVREDSEAIRYFGTAPDWNPWDRNAQGKHTYPPMVRFVREGGAVNEYPLADYRDYLNIVRNCKAILSKPGGATLNDSFSHAVPFVMLEPFGDHELHNMEYWEACGFGIRFEDWQSQGFAESSLELCYGRLAEQRLKKENFGRVYYAAKNSSYV